MSQNLEKLKALLAELFQLDQAELDFGIYRIMNTRREEIMRFLEHDLLPQVREALGRHEQESRSILKDELEKAKEQARQLGFDDPSQAPKVRELQARYDATFDIEAAENDVYSHLYNFFRRYYHEGDFISLRRYKEGVYAIPYEGEEVKLYWANHDQYYIKTSEYLRNYTFKLPSGKRVHFKLIEADTEKDNNRAANGNERRFILSERQPLSEENGELVIRFEYRPHPDKVKQADLNAAAVDRILNQTTEIDDWRRELASLRPTEKNPNRTLLEKHLTDYTARNTFDYFIHKDLGGFLRRELDFYIKNEVMHLDDIENETAPRVEQYLSKIKAIRRIAHKIIDFLAQIENFQKKLWLKKKFVVETQYCITLDRIFAIEDEKAREWLLDEIIKNDAQREEWVQLFAVNEIEGDPTTPGYSKSLTAEFLKANPTLVVDTRHFDEAFKLRLLAAIPDLDQETDGLLIHSENFQALNLLQARYQQQVKCIYIDPPFNTGKDEFNYKDGYQHSSWICMMSDRLGKLMTGLLSKSGVYFSSISDHELASLRLLLDSTLGQENFLATVEWNATKTVTNTALVSVGHIHNLVYGRDIEYFVRHRHHFRLPDPLEGFENPDNDPKGPWKADPFQVGGVRPNQQYEIINPNTGKIYRPNPGCSWKNDYETFQRLLTEGRIVFGKTGKGGPQRKRYLSEAEERGRVTTTWWDDVETTADGTRLLQDFFGSTVFTNPKPVSLIVRMVQLGTHDVGQIVLDHFAGSGTTGHAVINLNREDGGRRKFILVEMGDYFDTVLVPRIKKVTFTPEWKDGKPKRMPTKEEIERSPRIVKILRLESYEDTLNNLELKRTALQQTLLEQHAGFREDYMLRYMLDVESRGSASLLNLDRFEDPFSYKLDIATGSAGETKPTVVDLVETFNYLIGLRVKTMDDVRGVRVVTGLNPQGERVLILWRKTKELDNDALDAWFCKQGYNTKDQEYDVIYVNGDNNLENLRKADQTWKVRLIEEEFRRLMFDVQDA